MSSSETTESLLKKIAQQEPETLRREIEENETGKNTKPARQRLLRIAHYYHLLQNVDVPKEKAMLNRLEKYSALAKIKIQEAKDYAGRQTEMAEATLIAEHTAAWNLAEYYYEKAAKILCQMTITLMDYLLQEQSGISILYEGKDKSSYYNLLDEITALNNDYVDCCCFLAAYDYCTEKIADFTGIVEYRRLLKEHERIIANGLPNMVTNVLQKLAETADESKAKYFIEISKVFTPQPPYYEDVLKDQYERAVRFYGDEATAMSRFSELVVKVDEYYGACFKE